MSTASDFLNSYKQAVERIKDRHRKLSHTQQRRPRRKAGERTWQVKMDYQQWALTGYVRLELVWPRTDGLTRIARMDALEGTILNSQTSMGSPYVMPKLCNGLLPNFMAGKITAAEAVKRERASCAKG